MTRSKTIKSVVLSTVGIFLSAFACALFFDVTTMLIYRIVAVFLTLILVSNFAAKIVETYVSRKI